MLNIWLFIYVFLCWNWFFSFFFYFQLLFVSTPINHHMELINFSCMLLCYFKYIYFNWTVEVSLRLNNSKGLIEMQFLSHIIWKLIFILGILSNNQNFHLFIYVCSSHWNLLNIYNENQNDDSPLQMHWMSVINWWTTTTPT